MDNVLTYILTLDKTFNDYLSFIKGGFEEELVHDTRVSIKKLKAAFFFAEQYNRNFNAKRAYLFYREIFQRLGPIRDLQIQQHKFTEWSKTYKVDFGHYIEFLQTEEISYKKKFNTFIKKHKVNPQIYILKALDSELDPRTAQEKTLIYLYTLIDTIRAFDIKKIYTYEEVHNLRKHLKELQYNLSLIENTIFPKKMFRTITSQLKSLTESLGNWHDNYMFLSYLYSYKLNFFKASKKQMLAVNKFERELLKLNKQSIAKIAVKFKDFHVYSKRIEKFWKIQ